MKEKPESVAELTLPVIPGPHFYRRSTIADRSLIYHEATIGRFRSCIILSRSIMHRSSMHDDASMIIMHSFNNFMISPSAYTRGIAVCFLLLLTFQWAQIHCDQLLELSWMDSISHIPPSGFRLKWKSLSASAWSPRIPNLSEVKCEKSIIGIYRFSKSITDQ